MSRCLGLKAIDIGPTLTRDLCKTVAMTTKVLCRLVYTVRLERLYVLCAITEGGWKLFSCHFASFDMQTACYTKQNGVNADSIGDFADKHSHLQWDDNEYSDVSICCVDTLDTVPFKRSSVVLKCWDFKCFDAKNPQIWLYSLWRTSLLKK